MIGLANHEKPTGKSMAQWRERQRQNDPITVKTETQLLRDEVARLHDRLSSGEYAQALTDLERARCFGLVR
jgi:hypothetical protein